MRNYALEGTSRISLRVSYILLKMHDLNANFFLDPSITEHGDSNTTPAKLHVNKTFLHAPPEGESH
jgi:hypothetical protein